MVIVIDPHKGKYSASVEPGDQVVDRSGQIAHHLFVPCLYQFRFGLGSHKISFIGQMPGLFLALFIIGPFEGRSVMRVKGKHSLRKISISVPDEFFLADPAKPIEIVSNKEKRIDPDSTMLIDNC